MDEMKRIKQLVNKLNEASKAYYMEEREIMSNLEYDGLYDELEALEKKTQMVLSDSPTIRVGYEVVSVLPKERHRTPMLSLDKTKELTALTSWLKDQKALLSWKLDGLTISLTYEEGSLVKAITRGNGEIGEVITNNARVFKNVPLTIPYQETLLIRGEAVIKYSDFLKINENINDDEPYKNPRNLCSGSVRQLNNAVTAQRNVHFFAFQLVQAEGIDFQDSKSKQLDWLSTQGFECVDYKLVDRHSLEEAVHKFAAGISGNDCGSDGLVLTYDSISYCETLGATSKFPKHSIAYKWEDEIKETKLLYIEWSASRTGLINPIAVFEPVELEGTTVSRASLHNISIMEDLELGLGDSIEVYKANMIIPQIADNKSRTHTVEIPKECPVCGGAAVVKQVKDVRSLYCSNEECAAKKLKRYAHFVSRDAMNIEGLSEATLEKFVAMGLIKTVADLYRLQEHEKTIVEMEGFGKKSFENLIDALEKSKTVRLSNFIFALAIPNVGLSNAKLLSKHFKNDLNLIMKVTVEELLQVEGFGGIIAASIVDFFDNASNQEVLRDLLTHITFVVEEAMDENRILGGKVFVITGSLEKYESRNALKEKIERLGGKVTGSVTSKTNYLINNDVTSTSSKNKTAQSLGVEIIDEEGFESLLNS
ncbi:MAG: NAD-dependent DNA ligase LigA [Vallitaleaceae bacterium]|nr:NAD-dependent DNA ligase LigA [Vallitaleaceae bacterium]